VAISAATSPSTKTRPITTSRRPRSDFTDVHGQASIPHRHSPPGTWEHPVLRIGASCESKQECGTDGSASGCPRSAGQWQLAVGKQT
jgi:hypothetical protein